MVQGQVLTHPEKHEDWGTRIHMQHMTNDCLCWIGSTVIKRPTAKNSRGDQTLEQVAQSGCELSICGDTQSLTGHSPGQPSHS